MNNELYHYGVLGMRWGVRRSKSGSNGSGKRSKRSKPAIDPSYKKAHAKRKLKYTSDSDLREINNRLNAERQYKDLTRTKSRGKAAVDAFTSTAKTVATVAAAYKIYKKYGGEILKKIGNMKV